MKHLLITIISVSKNDLYPCKQRVQPLWKFGRTRYKPNIKQCLGPLLHLPSHKNIHDKNLTCLLTTLQFTPKITAQKCGWRAKETKQ